MGCECDTLYQILMNGKAAAKTLLSEGLSVSQYSSSYSTHFCTIFSTLSARTFNRPPEFTLDSMKVKMIVMAALQSLHGQVTLALLLFNIKQNY